MAVPKKKTSKGSATSVMPTGKPKPAWPLARRPAGGRSSGRAQGFVYPMPDEDGEPNPESAADLERFENDQVEKPDPEVVNQPHQSGLLAGITLAQPDQAQTTAVPALPGSAPSAG